MQKELIDRMQFCIRKKPFHDFGKLGRNCGEGYNASVAVRMGVSYCMNVQAQWSYKEMQRNIEKGISKR